MYCISVSHRNSTAREREQFAFSDEQQRKFCERLMKYDNVTGCVLLMTCNRSEIYYTGEGLRFEDVERIAADVKAITIDTLRNISMRYSEETSIRHLYRVACGLDSAVLGEVEIIRQVKKAYLAAVEQNAAGTEINMVFQGALRIAREMADKSLMTRLPVSVGTLAAAAVSEFCRNISNPHILVVGISGEMGGIVTKDILDICDSADIIGTSRRHSVKYAGISTDARVSLVHYDERYEYIEWADVIISATTSPHYTFLAKKVKECRKTSIKKQLYLDLAVPRDIDEDIAGIDGCTVKDMDYIKMLARDNNEKKLSEATRIETVIEKRVDETTRMLLIGDYIRDHGDEIKKLGDKSAMWLIYRLRDKLDCTTLKRVLEAVGEDI